MDRSSALRSALLLAGFCLLALLQYGPVLGAGLLSDDWALVGWNPWLAFRGHWYGGGPGTFYRPLSLLLIVGTKWAFGTGGLAHHVVSALLHGATAFVVARALDGIGQRAAGLVAGTLFVLHPVGVESVAWIASQTDVLSGFLFAAAVGSFAQRSTRAKWLSLVPAALCLMSKETGVLVFPCVAMLVLHGWATRGREGAGIAQALAHAGLLAAYFILRRALLGAFLPPSASGGFFAGLCLAAHGLHELLQPIVPLLPDADLFEAHRSIGNGAMIAAVAGIACLVRWRMWNALTAISMVAACLVLFATGAIDPGRIEGNMRYLHAPLVAFCAAAGLGLSWIAREFHLCSGRRRAVLLAGAAWVVVRCSLLSVPTMEDFRDAAEARDAISAEVDAKIFPVKGPVTVVVEERPLRAGGAYIFQNGFAEFLAEHCGRAVPVVETMRQEAMAPGTTFFRLRDARARGGSYLVPDARLAELAERGASPVAKGEPIEWDMASDRLRPDSIPFGSDVRFVGRSPEGWLLDIVGSDPNVPFPVRPSFVTGQHAEFVFEAAFPDVAPGATDTFELIAMPNGGPAITMGSTIALRREMGEYRIPLQQSIAWNLGQNVAWVRFDPGTGFPRRMVLKSMALR